MPFFPRLQRHYFISIVTAATLHWICIFSMPNATDVSTINVWVHGWWRGRGKRGYIFFCCRPTLRASVYAHWAWIIFPFPRKKCCYGNCSAQKTFFWKNGEATIFFLCASCTFWTAKHTWYMYLCNTIYLLGRRGVLFNPNQAGGGISAQPPFNVTFKTLLIKTIVSNLFLNS